MSNDHEWPAATAEHRAGTTTRVAVWRDYPFELRATEGGDGRTFAGYAAVFDSPTDINSWEGVFTETVKRGAFTRTLRDRTPVLMFNHGKHPSVGDMPIGAITSIREDDRGLFVEARLYDNPLVEPVRQAIAGGSITGMSFRFEALRDKWNGNKTKRELLELRVPEVGPVVFPAYAGTTANVRDEGTMTTKADRLRTVRELGAGTLPARAIRPVRKTTKAERMAAVAKLTRKGGALPDLNTDYGRQYLRGLTSDQRRRDVWLRTGLWVGDAAEQARQRAWASEHVMRSARQARAPAVRVLVDSENLVPRPTADHMAQADWESELRRRDEVKARDIRRWGGHAEKPVLPTYERQSDRRARR